MLNIDGSPKLHKIIVLNPKGGSGKTTLSFNLAGYLASTGREVALIDMDPQGSSTHWLNKRPAELPQIHKITLETGTRSRKGGMHFQVPEHIDYVVVDAPAAVTAEELIDYTCGAHAIIVPVLPSELDIHAATRLISSLLLVAQVSRRNGRLGVVANRVNERTIAYKRLMRFLDRLTISVVGVLRDSQNYVRAAHEGRCIHEMPPSRVSKELTQWESVTEWLEGCLSRPLTPRDLLRPKTAKPKAGRARRAWSTLIPVAAVLAIAELSMLLWFDRPTEPEWVSAATPTPAIVTAQAEVPEPSAEMESLAAEATADESASSIGERWQLSGVANSGDSSIVILEDRDNHTTRRVTTGEYIEGWSVTATGRDYAVFAQNGEEVRLEISARNDRQESQND